MKYVRVMGLVMLLSITLVQQAHAGFIGDTVTGTGIQDGGANIYSPSDVLTSNDYVEYEGAVSGVFDPEGAADPIDTIRLRFDFLESGSDTYLSLGADRVSGTGGIWEFTNLVVTLSDLDYSESGFVLAGLELIPVAPENYYFANQLQGISTDLGSDWIQFTFSNFRVSEVRNIDFRMIFEQTDGGPNTPVVPVPAAAPMVLLGIGVIAIARRFRGVKS